MMSLNVDTSSLLHASLGCGMPPLDGAGSSVEGETIFFMNGEFFSAGERPRLVAVFPVRKALLTLRVLFQFSVEIQRDIC